MLRSYREQGIVLRTYKLGEADRIVLILGRDAGLVRAVAKGVRKPTSKFGGQLEPFNLVDLQLYRGKNLHTITQAQLLLGYAGPLAENYGAFTAAKVLAETTQKLTEGNELADTGIFDLLHGALGALVARRHPEQLVVASFLLRLMRLAGWDPVLRGCAGCGSTGPARSFLIEAGGTVCASCSGGAGIPLSAETTQLVEALMEGRWEGTQNATAHERAAAGRVAGAWAQYHLEQRLRSLAFLESVEEHHEYS